MRFLTTINSNIFLALASGLLLFAAWPVSSLTFLIFIAWVPLLWLETKVQSRRKFFALVYITMFIWNVSTTWWIWNASVPGSLAAFFANSFIMCLPWLGYHIAKKRLGETIGYISLVAFWICFEYIHLLDWGLSWPWLTLGNVFATHPDWIQWYEYTGSSGGSLWVLVVNIFIFLHLRQAQYSKQRKTYKNLVSAVVLLLLPVTLSFLTARKITVPDNGPNIVVVQPNIDPYEKVSTGTFEGQLQKLIENSEKVMDDSTALLVWPETALYTANRINETEMKENAMLSPVWSFLQKHPYTSLFTGVESFRVFDSATSSSEEYNGFHYESYNGSVLLDSNGASAFYHKSMLVPGVETLPWFLKFVSKWFDKFGGTTAGYTKQKDRTVLADKHGYNIAPAICYESVYGEFMSKYVKNGANLICIITNDGWWKKTPGHKQHMNYARLRAIETRIWIARSANTGISCFVDPSGRVINPQPYDTEAAIKLPVSPGGLNKTFFVKYGDILSKVFCGLSIFLVLLVLYDKGMKGLFKKKFPALQSTR